MLIVSSDSQLENAYFPIDSKHPSIITDVSKEQLLNAELPIFSTFLGITIVSNDSQLRNAP